jgi:hypothetical protein
MNFWDKVKNDLQKGVEEGIAIVREGANVVWKKTEEFTDEGKRRYRIFDLKTRVQKEISELGGRVYELSGKATNPMRDSKVKAVQSRIKKLEAEIMKLEGKPLSDTEKVQAKRRTKTKGDAGKMKKSTVKKVSPAGITRGTAGIPRSSKTKSTTR